MDPARLRNIPVFSDRDDEEIGHTGWDTRRLRETAPNAVDHLRGLVAQRHEHA